MNKKNTGTLDVKPTSTPKKETKKEVKKDPKKVSVKVPNGVSLSVIEAQLKEQYGDDVIMLIED